MADILVNVDLRFKSQTKLIPEIAAKLAVLSVPLNAIQDWSRHKRAIRWVTRAKLQN
jgi:hypothetical protein